MMAYPLRSICSSFVLILVSRELQAFSASSVAFGFHAGISGQASLGGHLWAGIPGQDGTALEMVHGRGYINWIMIRLSDWQNPYLAQGTGPSAP
jgi:hypothetical protein